MNRLADRASPLVAPIYNALPLPSLPAQAAGISMPGWGAYAQGFSVPTDQQTVGLRLDHYFSDKLIGFLRYNDAPSNFTNHFFGLPLTAAQFDARTRMLTLGLTLAPTPTLVNDFRANSSWQDVVSGYSFVSLGGARDPSNALFPPGHSAEDSLVFVNDSNFPGIPQINVGKAIQNHSRQFQVVDQVSYVHRGHQWKFWGRLSAVPTARSSSANNYYVSLFGFVHRTPIEHEPDRNAHERNL